MLRVSDGSGRGLNSLGIGYMYLYRSKPYAQARAHKNGRLEQERVTPIVRVEFPASTKIRTLVTCTLSNINVYTACAVCVTIFSTGRKFCPVSIFT